MWIRVAAGAVLEGHRAKDRHASADRIHGRAEARGLVTLGTGDVLVLARERVLGSRVVERRGILPLPRIVTARAGPSQAPAMGIGVAARALALEADPANTRTARRELHGRRHLETRRVARGALRRYVALFEGVPRAARMIEPLWRTTRPLNELKVPASVVGVTAGASPARVNAGVEAAPLLLEPRDLAVTGEAPLRRGLLPPAVTLRAVRRALESRVWARQRPGRDLRAHARWHDHGRDERDHHHDDRVRERPPRPRAVSSPTEVSRRWPPRRRSAAP